MRGAARAFRQGIIEIAGMTPPPRRGSGHDPVDVPESAVSRPEPGEVGVRILRILIKSDDERIRAGAAEKGVDVALAIAEQCPDIPFAS